MKRHKVKGGKCSSTRKKFWMGLNIFVENAQESKVLVKIKEISRGNAGLEGF